MLVKTNYIFFKKNQPNFLFIDPIFPNTNYSFSFKIINS